MASEEHGNSLGEAYRRWRGHLLGQNTDRRETELIDELISGYKDLDVLDVSFGDGRSVTDATSRPRPIRLAASTPIFPRVATISVSTSVADEMTMSSSTSIAACGSVRGSVMGLQEDEWE